MGTDSMRIYLNFIDHEIITAHYARDGPEKSSRRIKTGLGGGKRGVGVASLLILGAADRVIYTRCMVVWNVFVSYTHTPWLAIEQVHELRLPVGCVADIPCSTTELLHM